MVSESYESSQTANWLKPIKILFSIHPRAGKLAGNLANAPVLPTLLTLALQSFVTICWLSGSCGKTCDARPGFWSGLCLSLWPWNMARTAAVPCHAMWLKVGLLRVDLCPPVSACVDGYFVQLCPSFQLSEGACHASGLTHTGPWDQCAGMGGQWSYGMHKGYQSTLCQSFASKIFEILKYESIINYKYATQYATQHAL